MKAPDQTENPASLAVGRGIIGGRWGFIIGLFAGGLVMLLAWGWSPNALALGSAIALATTFIGVISGLATGATHRRRVVVLRAVIGSLIASPTFIAVTVLGIPRLFQPRVLSGESRRLVLIVLKSVSPVHFAFAILVGLIVGMIIARMKEDPHFTIALRR